MKKSFSSKKILLATPFALLVLMSSFQHPKFLHSPIYASCLDTVPPPTDAGIAAPVKKIWIRNNMAVVTFRSGEQKHYDLSDNDQRTEFEQLYGMLELPPAPEPPALPKSPVAPKAPVDPAPKKASNLAPLAPKMSIHPAPPIPPMPPTPPVPPLRPALFI